MFRVFRTWVERLTPRQQTEDETDRARFLVQVWGLAALVWLAYLPLNLASRMWGQLALAAVLLACSVVILALLWRGVRLRTTMHLSLGTLTAGFGAAALMQQPFDATNLVALALVPLMASYLLGRESGRWLVAALASAGAAYALGLAGVGVPVKDPTPVASALFNLGFTLLVAWVFTRRFDQLRQRSLERMQDADRAKNVFLATVGHEIRTPMNGVLGMTEVMLAEPQSPHQREQLEVILRSGRGLVSLVNDLLDISRLEAGKLTIDVAAFDLDAALHDAEALARPLAAQKGLRFVVDRAPGVPSHLLGDVLRVSQVLNNLLNNAIKFTEAGEVRLGVAVDDERLVLTVKDTGPGVAPEDQQRIFRAFEQLDGSARRRHAGTGLGLAITRQLVALLGGTLSLESSPGRGSTFRVALPLVRAPGPLAPAPQAQPAAAAPAGHVLVVDDNPVNLKVATAMVEKAGYSPLAASSGEQALALFDREAVCLVLMDCHMPGMDGFEATTRLRAHERGRTLPIVAVTASAGPDDVAACQCAGMDDFLAKPVRLDQVRDVLRRFLGQPQAQAPDTAVEAAAPAPLPH